MKKIIFVLLPFLSQACGGQTSSNPKDLNTIFDNAIRKDTTLNVVRTTLFPKVERPAKVPKTLTYSSKLKLYDDELRAILDDTAFSEADKIAWIKQALADTSRDAFEYMYSRSIKFWRSSKETTKLIEQYFASKAFEHSDKYYIKYKHFEFFTNSLYPQAYDSIVQYFNKRDTLAIKYPNEGRLVHVLLKLGKEKEALHYLEILINDCLKGKIKTNTLDIKAFPLFTQTDPAENVFEHFCFSNNPEIAEKATDLLFQLLESYDYDTYNLYPLTAFLDRARHIKLLEKRFKHFAAIDFSKLDPNKTTSADRKLLHAAVPENYSFFSFMYSSSLMLGEVQGRAIWQKFVETMPYWNMYGQPFEMSQMYILENSFRDTSLSQKEMRTMLMQCKKTERLFNNFDGNGSYKARFLQLLCKAYPDKKVPKEDFEKLQLSKILRYTHPLQITSYDLNVVVLRKNLTPAATDSLVNNISSFSKKANLPAIHLTKKERFLLSRKSAEGALFDWFSKNNRMIGFDAEGSSIPTNYIELFEEEFEPLLQKAGITNIDISQTTTKISNDFYHYKIYVKCGDVIYLHEHKEEGTDWYNQQRLSKMLNLCLMQIKSPLRLVEAESGDQTVNIILCEPRTLKPLLTKYRINSWAVTREDDFMNAGH
jgi:hypothetical protein